MSFPFAARPNTRTFRRRLARGPRGFPRLSGLYRHLVAALSGAVGAFYALGAQAEPPPTALPVEATSSFITSGSASIAGRTTNSLTILQESQRATLNWQSFNIGRDATVTFRQPNAQAAVLNRIQQGSPSEIFGALRANGQVYLINQNGFLFGKTARVDTHSLIASTHGVTDEIFNTTGIAGAVREGKAAFEVIGPSGPITIEEGAVLKADEGGSITVFAPRIENRGEIHTPGGQAILAASEDKVYLADSSNPDLRGLLVEVGTGGSIENLGKIVAERGNISIVGLAVSQNGVARATTAVNLNGSVHLLARDQVIVHGNGSNGMTPGRTGTLTLGANSVTEVAPDDLAQRAVDAQAQSVSRINMVGNQVTLKGGAKVIAPSGKVEITATTIADRAVDFVSDLRTDSRILIESGATVDVSGLESAVIPMERNVVTAELRGNELRDAAVQRNGVLRGQTVKVDARQGTPLADLSGQITGIERPLDERLATGGTVSMVSQGDVVVQPGATVDVSGGAVRYQDGFIETTQLMSQGRIYDIGSADPNRVYDGVVSTPRRRFEAGYVEGKDAGRIELNAFEMHLDGALKGGATAGRNQRLPTGGQLTGFMRPYNQLPLGGELALGRAGASTTPGLTDFTLGSLGSIGAEGMNRVAVYAKNSITVPADAALPLGPQGELTLDATHVEIAGDVSSPGGRLDLGSNNPGSTLTLRSGARLDVAGLWINDSTVLNPGGLPATPIIKDGGSVTLTASAVLALEAGSVIDADGGAHLGRNGDLSLGEGGDIKLSAKIANSQQTVPELRAEGDMHAYGFEQGGRLDITAGGFRIGGGPGGLPTGTIHLFPAAIQTGGFRQYTLTATHDGITLVEGTTITPRMQNRIPASDAFRKATGTPLDEVGSIGTLHDYQRQPVSLSLNYARAENADIGAAANVEIRQGAAILADPGAEVSLRSDTRILLDGAIEAPGGAIDLRLVQPADSDNERGFDRTQAIWLGEGSRLLAAAAFIPAPDVSGRGLRLGTMLDGGTVNVAAERGYIIAHPGSTMDVSGATQVQDIQQGVAITETEVSGRGGAIKLTAAEGMVLGGEFRGQRGSGQDAPGGSLTITLDHSKRAANVIPGFEAYPTGPRKIILSEAADVAAPAPGTPVPDSRNGTATLDSAKVATGGFDNLALEARSASADFSEAAIRFEGDVTLATSGALILSAPVVESDGGVATLRSAYVRMGTPQGFFGASADAQAGNGRLSVSADHVDLHGTLALRGFGDGGNASGEAAVRVESTGDIRLIGGDEAQSRDDGVFTIGRLNAASDLVLKADQVYAASTTDFRVSVAGEESRVMIEPGDSAAATPLSAGSRIEIRAAHIEQRGTLRAPFGQIELKGGKSLVLDGGSLTSVSGDAQLVPFGSTEFGADWVYRANSGIARVYEAAPEKRIVTSAPDVTIATGSVADLSGGGDLLAREHVPGPGGSTDILDPAVAAESGAFAILPARGNEFGYYDPLLSASSLDMAGRTIHLEGGGLAPAGEYAVLPAGYALLPGAFLITPVETEAPLPGQVTRLASGATVVAGKRGAAGTDARDSLYSAFLIEDGALVRNRAEYLESRADEFFAAGSGPLNRDAGTLLIDARDKLALGGRLANSAAGGRGAEVDIIAERLAVVKQETGAGDRVEILASGLNALDADSLLLGGSRSRAHDVLDIETRASEVIVESGSEITAPETMLAARDRVTVADGARITAQDGDRVQAPDEIALQGDGAFARASAGGQVEVSRTGSTGAAGTLEIAAGAVVTGTGSITLDASKDTVVVGELATDQGSLSLGGSRISIGETDGVTGGLVLSNDKLASLNAQEVILRSRSTVDLYGAASLDAGRIVIDAAGLAGYTNAGKQANLRADTVSLSNRGNASFTGTADGIGTLDVAARQIVLGEGDFNIRGFGSTRLAAGDAILAQPETDNPVALHAAGELAIETPRLAATSGVDVTLDTRDASGAITGGVTLTAPAAAPAAVADSTAPGLGAKFDITAASIALGSKIEAPSGIVNVRATGAGGIRLDAGADIDVAGRDLLFDDLIVGSPGGSVALIADQGGVNIAIGARIDVSGGAAGGDAGKLSVSTPNGAFTLDTGAAIAATAAASARAGTFRLDAGSLPDSLSALNNALNTAGFTAARDLRVRTGDMAIGAGETVRAQEFRLAADSGRIDVSGTIDASGTEAGEVALFAGGDLNLHGSARIDAHAIGAGEEGGRVTLSSRDGRVTLAATDDPNAAGVDVSGRTDDGAGEDSGTVHIRARRDTDSIVAVDPIATRIVGASAINVEAVKTYTASQIDNALIGTIRSETDAFMANADAIESSLGAAADPRIKMVPGVQIQSAGDLDLNTGWDLLDWRYGGQAGVLTLHAAGNLNLNQSLSDAVKPESALDGFTPRDVVQTGPSWTYRIVAGAVSAAADPLAVTSEIGAPGDVVLKSGTIVRTGTGDIGIAAAHDLRFEDSSAVIYTAGENRGPGALPANSAGGPEVTQELLYAADFLKDGGDIRIAAGNDVIGKNSGQLVNEWLARVGNENNVLPTGDSFSIGSSWAVSVGNFRQTIGALGGGDVSVTAGGSLRDLSVVVPTTGLPTGEVGALPDIAGGGDIHVEAGGDLRGGMIYLGKGKARVNVGGSVLGSDTMPALPVLALGDGQYTVQARKDLGVDAVVNPTVLSMNPAQGTPDIGKVAADNVFFTYGPESAVRLGSIAGSLSLRGDVNAMKGTFTALNSTSDSEPLRYFPGDLRLRSLQGDVRIEPSITLLPSPEGNLEILAQRDIRPGSSNTTVRMSDADPALLPGVANPRTGLAASGGEDVANQLLEHSPTLLHTGDSVVARVTAQTGTIGSPDDNPLAFQLRLEIPKPARVFAGSDINNLALSVQHANATDISVVQAGGEIVFPTLRDGDGSVSTRTDREFEFAGPGEVYILAGRDVDLGAAKGIVSIGNQDNPALPDGGANITVMTGQKTPAAYDSFIDKYLVQSDAYSEALTAYMQSLGLTDTSVGAFQSLPRDKQRKLIHEILFAALREAGKRAAETGQTEDYERGYDAIRTLFPADSYPGDLKSFLSRIYTRDGGDINLIVPGGLVNAGVASATAIAKQPDELGVVAESTGNINAMVHGDFLVNQSRVFALDGGDLLLWSSAGDIDAGKGAKTALAVPPPVAVTDVHGNTIVEFPPAISGSGIKSSVRTIGREPGDVFLVAPAGIVDAGDAGIEAAGNITIAATAVLGASNIKVGGVSVGVPAGGSGAGAVSASVSAAAASAAKSGEEGATQKTAVMDKDGNISIIEVEVVGFGNENDGEKEDKKDCKPNDKDCQKG